MSRAALVPLTAILLTGCVGEAGVRYHGAVVSSPQPGYSFNAQPSTEAPIAGADVRMCICHEPCSCEKEGRATTTDASGRYEIPETIFPGMIGIDNIIVVRAAKDGFDPVTYSFNYDKRSDEDRKREPSSGENALTFRLKPSASATTATPAPTAAPAPAPSADTASWMAIETKVAACPDGKSECLEVMLPTDGYVSFEGRSPHDWGCGNHEGGKIVASVEQRFLRLQMRADGPHGGLCRAMAWLRGTGTAGPLAAGSWLLVPDREPSSSATPYSPLHIGAVKFFPKR